MPKSKKSTQYPFVLVGINTEKIDTKYNLSNTEKVIPLNTTRIIDLEPEVPEIISFLDETKKVHKCQVSMIDFNSGKNVSKWEKYQFDDEYDESPLIDCRVPTKQNDMFSGVDAKDTGLVEKDTGLVEKDTGLVEKDIRLVMSQTCVTRKMAIATLRKHDGDIVNAIMELDAYCVL